MPPDTLQQKLPTRFVDDTMWLVRPILRNRVLLTYEDKIIPEGTELRFGTPNSKGEPRRLKHPITIPAGSFLIRIFNPDRVETYQIYANGLVSARAGRFRAWMKEKGVEGHGETPLNIVNCQVAEKLIWHLQMYKRWGEQERTEYLGYHAKLATLSTAVEKHKRRAYQQKLRALEMKNPSGKFNPGASSALVASTKYELNKRTLILKEKITPVLATDLVSLENQIRHTWDALEPVEVFAFHWLPRIQTTRWSESWRRAFGAGFASLSQNLRAIDALPYTPIAAALLLILERLPTWVVAGSMPAVQGSLETLLLTIARRRILDALTEASTNLALLLELKFTATEIVERYKEIAGRIVRSLDYASELGGEENLLPLEGRRAIQSAKLAIQGPCIIGDLKRLREFRKNLKTLVGT
ncbi:MAG: hypothetical protein V1821_02115 [bacterium]